LLALTAAVLDASAELCYQVQAENDNGTKQNLYKESKELQALLLSLKREDQFYQNFFNDL
jgi:hypothetical protein